MRTATTIRLELGQITSSRRGPATAAGLRAYNREWTGFSYRKGAGISLREARQSSRPPEAYGRLDRAVDGL